MMDIEKMNEQYMSSRQWLEKYGLAARKLELFDVLSGVAFKHKDGVVGLKTHPGNDFQTDAVSSMTGQALALWVKFSADDVLKYLLLIFLRKQDPTFLANCLHGDNLHEMSDPLF